MFLYILEVVRPGSENPPIYIFRHDQRQINWLKRDLVADGEVIASTTVIPIETFGECAHMLWALIEVEAADPNGPSNSSIEKLINRNLMRHRRTQMTVVGAGRILMGAPKALWNSWRRFDHMNKLQDLLLFRLHYELGQRMKS